MLWKSTPVLIVSLILNFFLLLQLLHRYHYSSSTTCISAPYSNSLLDAQQRSRMHLIENALLGLDNTSFYVPHMDDTLVNGWNKLDRMLVVASYLEDTSWIDLSLGDFPHVIYKQGDPFSVFHADQNRGNEASVYLHFIINHYEALPRCIAFFHGHRPSWHSFDTVQRIRDTPVWENCDFCSLSWRFKLNISNATYPDQYERLVNLWPHYFASDYGPNPPERLFRFCCAEFIVSRERIYLHSKQFYEDLYSYLMSTSISSRLSGRVFEDSWHFLFGEPYIVPDYPYSSCAVDPDPLQKLRSQALYAERARNHTVESIFRQDALLQKQLDDEERRRR
eukprot:TRINITY_DN7904_c0_g1_i1.p1 TRINITY_DN7904_c0_g1~~TRINITY_DN7904_c0_g1_i1.p1  ORF type:complete len:336 (+),score=35.63 TRINITY_DN7904_c0_g1_i1:110-1117(+)